MNNELLSAGCRRYSLFGMYTVGAVCCIVFFLFFQYPATALEMPFPESPLTDIALGEEEKTLQLTFSDPLIKGVSFSGTAKPEKTEQGWILDLSADPIFYSDKELRITYIEDADLAPVRYMIRNIQITDKSIASYPVDAIPKSEIWILNTDFVKVKKEGETAALYSDADLRVEKGGVLAVVGKGSFSIGSASSGKPARITIEEGGQLFADVTDFYNGDTVSPSDRGAKGILSAEGGSVRICVKNAFYNGGGSKGEHGVGYLYVSSGSRVVLRGADTDMFFENYSDFPSGKEADHFINGKDNGPGYVYLNWDGETAADMAVIEKDIFLDTPLSDILPHSLTVGGEDREIQWDLDGLSVTEPGDYRVSGSFSCFHAEDIRISASLRADKSIPAAPSVPFLISVSEEEIHIAEKAGIEYSIDNGVRWSGNARFSGLQPGTRYAVIARLKETENSYAGTSSRPLLVLTEKGPHKADPSSCQIKISGARGAARQGKQLDLYVFSDGTDITNPAEGDTAYFPQKWETDEGEKYWTAPPYHVSYTPRTSGTMKMFFTFRLCEFDGTTWNGTKETKRIAVPVKVAPGTAP